MFRDEHGFKEGNVVAMHTEVHEPCYCYNIFVSILCYDYYSI